MYVFLCELYSFLIVNDICTKVYICVCVLVFVLNVCSVVKCVRIGETFPTIPMGSHDTENHTWVKTF